jgi:hypothetical protein
MDYIDQPKIKKLKLDWIRGQCNKGVYVITNA